MRSLSPFVITGFLRSLLHRITVLASTLALTVTYGADPSTVTPPTGSADSSAPSTSAPRKSLFHTVFDVKSATGHPHNAIAISRTGTVLATQQSKDGNDCQVVLLDTYKNAVLHQIDGLSRFASHTFADNADVLLVQDLSHVTLYSANSGDALFTIKSDDEVKASGISADGRYVALTDSRPSVSLWDVSTHKMLWQATDVDSHASCFAFAPDGKSLAVLFNDRSKRIHTYDIPSGSKECEASFDSYISQAIFTAAGQSLFVAGDRKVHVLELSADRKRIASRRSGECRIRAPNHVGYSQACPVSVIVSEPGEFATTLLSDLTSADPPPIDGVVDETIRQTAAVCPQTGRLFSVARGMLRVYSPDRTTQLLRSPALCRDAAGGRQGVVSLVLSASGDTAAVLWESGYTTVVDVAALAKAEVEATQSLVTKEISRLRLLREDTAGTAKRLCGQLANSAAENGRGVRELALRGSLCAGNPAARTGFRVLTQALMGRETVLAVKDIYEDAAIATLKTHAMSAGETAGSWQSLDEKYETCEMSPSGALVAVVYDGRVGVFSTDTGDLLHSFEAETGSTTLRPVFSVDESVIVTASRGNRLTVRCSYTGHVKKVLEPPDQQSPATHVATATSAPLLAVLYRDSGLVVRQVDTGKAVAFMPNVPPGASLLTLSRAGDMVAVASTRRVMLWRIQDGRLSADESFDQEVTGIALRSDGSALVVALEGGVACSLNTLNGELQGVWRLGGEGDTARRLQWSEDDSLLVACFSEAVEWYSGDELLRNKATTKTAVGLSPVGRITGGHPHAWFVGADNKCLVALSSPNNGGLTRTALPVSEILEQHRVTRANRQPAEGDALDLSTVLAESGCELREYVQYGDMARAAKAAKGDRFDKEDAEEEATKHRSTLKEKVFFYTVDYEWEKSIEEAGHIVITAQVPFLCNFKTDDTVISRECDEQAWLLLPNGGLRLCVSSEEILANRDRIYFPEDKDSSKLVVRVSGSRDVLRGVARKEGDCKMTIVFKGMQSVPRAMRRFYRADAVGLKGDCSSVRLASGKGAVGAMRDYLSVEAGVASPPMVEVDLMRVEIARLDQAERRVLMSWPAAEAK